MAFHCPECSVKLKVKPEQAGKRFRCPRCRTVLAVPDADEIQLEMDGAVSAAETGSVQGISTPGVAPISKAAALAPWEIGNVLLGDYEVELHLERGGMGDVYLVRSGSSGEQLAVKRVLPNLVQNERHRRTFLNELRTWIDLPEHPNLKACRFFRTLEEQVIVFAEYVEGGSLEERIPTRRPLATVGKHDALQQLR